MKGKQSVLLVDDKPSNVEMLSMLLDGEGYTVLEAFSGAQALDIAVNQQPDIILLDIMMPKMDGYEVTRCLKSSAQTRTIPVVLVTALNQISDQVKGLDAGADEFLSKPVNRIELIARVRALLRMKAFQEELKKELKQQHRFNHLPHIIHPHTHEQDHILIIEDDPHRAEQLAVYLQRKQYKTYAASSSDEVDVITQESQPDLLLLDLMLNGVNGVDYLKALRSDPRYQNTPIITITDIDSLETKAECFDSGADDYIVRPFHYNELLARIQASLRRSTCYTALKNNINELKQENTIDPLTNLKNRRFLDAFLENIFNNSIRYPSRNYSLIMADIDHFKSINDKYGHTVGDYILRKVADLLADFVRSTDIVARYGGEEFCIVLPETPINAAHRLSEKIRHAVMKQEYPKIDSKLITVSLGVSGFCPQDTCQLDALNRADSGLYQAKRNGRNCVYTINDPSWYHQENQAC